MTWLSVRLFELNGRGRKGGCFLVEKMRASEGEAGSFTPPKMALTEFEICGFVNIQAPLEEA